MELILTTQDLDPLPLRKQVVLPRKKYGILNTSFKSMANENLKNLNDDHIFSVRTRIKNQRFSDTVVTPDGIFKFVLFLAATVVLF